MDKKKKRGRPISTAKAIEKLKSLGVFRAADALRVGIPQQTLSRFAANNQIEKLDNQLYIHPESELMGVEREFAVACSKFGPTSVVGLNTALFYYNLTEVIPKKTWVLVNKKPNRKYPTYKLILTSSSNKIGIDDHGTYRITDLERTLVEALKYSRRIGLSTALKAIRQSLKDKTTTIQKIYEAAKALGMQKYIERHWEAIDPESEAS